MSDVQNVDETVEMIFRTFSDGQVIALMPGLTDTYHALHECMSYMHVGQHGQCDLKGVIASTRLATPAEYQELYLELRYRDYVIKVIKRATQRHTNMRRELIRGYNAQK